MPYKNPAVQAAYQVEWRRTHPTYHSWYWHDHRQAKAIQTVLAHPKRRARQPISKGQMPIITPKRADLDVELLKHLHDLITATSRWDTQAKAAKASGDRLPYCDPILIAALKLGRFLKLEGFFQSGGAIWL
jgi:hypothetical protein